MQDLSDASKDNMTIFMQDADATRPETVEDIHAVLSHRQLTAHVKDAPWTIDSTHAHRMREADAFKDFDDVHAGHIFKQLMIGASVSRPHTS